MGEVFGIIDVIDILLVATLLFSAYKLMKEFGSVSLFFGIIVFLGICVFITKVSNMTLTGKIIEGLGGVVPLMLVVLFQDEIRRFFLTLGSRRHLGFLQRMFKAKRKNGTIIGADENPSIMQIVLACKQMSEKYVGAIIILERRMSLEDIVSTGELVDARISSALLQNIFFKNSPLHDGAVIISKDRIKAARCILPVSHSVSIPSSFGLRHRAALGIVQQSDAIAIVLSEETGNITIAQKGELKTRIQIEELERFLTKIYEENN